jgi:hypothetical protein
VTSGQDLLQLPLNVGAGKTKKKKKKKKKAFALFYSLVQDKQQGTIMHRGLSERPSNIRVLLRD